eukprot:scaffold401_cov399-Prasinococcus_capsulatus_cf.AAC.3
MFEGHSRVTRRDVIVKLARKSQGLGKEFILLSPTLVSASRNLWLFIKGLVEKDVNAALRDRVKSGSSRTENSSQVPAQAGSTLETAGPSISAPARDVEGQQSDEGSYRRLLGSQGAEVIDIERTDGKEEITPEGAPEFAQQDYANSSLVEGAASGLGGGHFSELDMNIAEVLSPRVNLTKRERIDAILNTISIHERRITFHKKPMSGMVAVYMALQLCDSIDLYGFEAYTQDALRQGLKYHYFDKQQAFTWVHSFELALEVFRRLGDFFPLRVH